MKKYILIIVLLPLVLLASPFHTKQQIEQISSSVVKIYTAYVKFDYCSPWKKGINSSSTGTGVIINDNLILTAAHVVSDGIFIQVKKSNDAKKYTAKVKWIAHEADLALLELTDSSFFENMTPQGFGGLPYKQDGVVVYGYPMGGANGNTKYLYIHKKDAEQARDVRQREQNITLKIYACPTSTGWHLTKE